MARVRSYGTRVGLQSGNLPYRYELVPYSWVADAGPARWRLPAPAVGGVDMRPLPAQALAGGAPQGFAFAACRSSPGGVAIAAAQHMNDADATAVARDAWQSATGYRPAGAKVVDLLWDQLTAGADPSGDAGPKPLVPGVDNVLRLFVGGHSLVKSEQFAWGAHPHTNRLQALLRRDFEALWEATNGHDHCRRVLDFTCKKYRVADWREFVPARLHAHVPGRLPHQTTLTDNFNRADADALGASWTEVEGDYDIASNQAAVATASGWSTARYESDLSGDDHYSQVLLVGYGGAAGFDYIGSSVRFDAAANTCYVGMVQVSGNQYVYKKVAGTGTELFSAAVVMAVPDAIKVQADGSTIKAFYDGVEKISGTDTAITGNVRAGLGGFRSGGTHTLDDWEAADLAAAPAGNRRRRVLIAGAGR